MQVVAVACQRCGSRRVAQSKCLDCWWRPGDWFDGRMAPVATRIVFERSDGTRWMWAQHSGGSWYQKPA